MFAILNAINWGSMVISISYIFLPYSPGMYCLKYKYHLIFCYLMQTHSYIFKCESSEAIVDAYYKKHNCIFPSFKGRLKNGVCLHTAL